MTNLGFILEYGLGQTTHAQNMKSALADSPTVRPTYIDLPYDNRVGWWKALPGVRSNWSVRASLGAYLALRPLAGSLEAALFHTQVTSLFSAGFMRRVPSVISLDATPIQIDSFGAYYGQAAHPGGRMEAVKKRMNERAFESARHLVTFSQWAKDSLVADYGVPEPKVTVARQGVDVSRFAPDASSRPGDGVVRLLFVGGDFTRKGGDLLLRWARETQVRPPWELHLVTGADVPDTPGVVVHRGVTNNSDRLVALYRRCDLFVLPTRADCSPWVLMEAAAAGLPTVTTRVGALSEMIFDDQTGVIVPADDFGALSHALDALVADPDLRARQSAAARDIALSHFDQRANYRSLIALLQGFARK